MEGVCFEGTHGVVLAGSRKVNHHLFGVPKRHGKQGGLGNGGRPLDWLVVVNVQWYLLNWLLDRNKKACSSPQKRAFRSQPTNARSRTNQEKTT